MQRRSRPSPSTRCARRARRSSQGRWRRRDTWADTSTSWSRSRCWSTSPILKELARVTRAGGLLLLTTPNFGGLSRRWLGLGWRVVDPEHLGYFTARTLARALTEAGYGRVRTRARSLDISTWRRGRGRVAAFDPHAAARVRDGVQSSATLRAAKEAVNVVLGATGLGDTLLTWARR